MSCNIRRQSKSGDGGTRKNGIKGCSLITYAAQNFNARRRYLAGGGTWGRRGGHGGGPWEAAKNTRRSNFNA